MGFSLRFPKVPMRFLSAFVLLTMISGCGMIEYRDQPRKEEEKPQVNPEGIFGPGGLLDPNKGGKFGDEALGTGEAGRIGVNAFLWRATLDTVSFMPVTSVDPFGGVVLTDWHAAPAAPDERFKLNIYILGRSLRADGLRVAAFRQVRGADGWTDAAVPPEVSGQLEDAILTRARQLRADAIARNRQ